MSIIPIKIEPIEGEEGTWRIYLSGQAYLDCREGGTGACWNIREANDEDGPYLHICDLDDAIAALTALRDSEAHRRSEERWYGKGHKR